MQLNYLGPLWVGTEHPMVNDIAADQFPPSCYLVEVRAGAGIEGKVIEGDVLMVDESRPVQHADLVVVAEDGELRLFTSHRIGGSMRLVPASGGQGHQADPETCRGVVVRQSRIPAS